MLRLISHSVLWST